MRRKGRKSNYDKFPTTNKEPKEGDIWLVKFPYITKGGMEKLRPAVIVENRGYEIKVRKITSNEKRGKKISENIKTDRVSYLTKEYAVVGRDKLYRKIGRI